MEKSLQPFILIGFFGILIWIISQFGIEQALAVGTIVSGIIWFSYRIIAGKKKKGDELPYYVDFARSFFPIFLAVLLLRAFLIEPFRIPSGSMMPNLLIGDFILVNKYTYGIRMPVTKRKILNINLPARGDVVVFRWPIDERLDYIKRVVGLPGDKVSYKDKTLFINDKPMLIESLTRYIPEGSGMRALGSLRGIENLEGIKHPILLNPMSPNLSASCQFLESRIVTIPDGFYLMVGDNRDDSNDGRCWGLVPEKNLVGKAFLIWFSLDWERPGIVAWNRIGNLIN